MAAAPRIVTRREWGAASSIPGGRGVAPSARRHFVVHWPVMVNRDERQWCRDVERIHRGQGWAAAPGYNFLVGQSGTVFEGCGRDVRGIHSPPRNTDGFGVCLLQPSTASGTPTAPISQAMRTSTRQLWLWLNSVCGRTLRQTWHGQDFATACPGPDLRAWVQGGMQAQGAAPAPPPPTTIPEDEDMVASAVSANGTLHLFVATARAVFVTWQGPNTTSWNGGRAGVSVAGLMRLCGTPDNRNIQSITAFTTRNGVMHLVARFRDGVTAATWQRPNETGWSGGVAGQRIAALSYLAPAP